MTAGVAQSVAALRLTTLMGAGSLADHRRWYGSLPDLSGPQIINLVDRAGLRGRGGAGFPTARKLRAVRAGRRPVVLANGCEGEPASAKDRTLLCHAPHLVLDGALLAARAVGAQEVVVCAHEGSPAVSVLAAALGERRYGADQVRVRVEQVPRHYVASEGSALVHFLNSGDARPLATPPRMSERGVGGRPTLVDNVETLAQLALIVAQGPEWFREAGTTADPGSALVTIGGAVDQPGVYEISLGSTLGGALGLAGPEYGVSAVLVGGYFGTWMPLPAAAGYPLSHDPVGPDRSTIGAGTIFALPPGACGLSETARVVTYLAGQSAGQCGPCAFGLPAVAAQLQALVAGRLDRAGYQQLFRRLDVIAGRGACGHPDGAVHLTRSALRVFSADVGTHLGGYACRGQRHPAVLPVPRDPDEWWWR